MGIGLEVESLKKNIHCGPMMLASWGQVAKKRIPTAKGTMLRISLLMARLRQVPAGMNDGDVW